MRQGVPSVGVELNKPIVAAVHGWCIGGAYCIVQMCDLVVETIKKFSLDTMPRAPAEAGAISRSRLLEGRESSDGAEGRRAFGEKRKPKFTGN